MKKRLLSVALILSMLASLLMVGIVGPASAERITYSTTSTTQNVSYDMTGVTINSSAGRTPNGEFVLNGNKGATIKDLGESDPHGYVLDFNNDGSRGTFVDSGIFVEGKKYYISFDGRSMSGAAQKMTFYLANLANAAGNNITLGSQNSKCRYEFKDSSPFEFYINGNKLESYADFKLSTDWQHFGIIIDLTDTNVVSTIESYKDAGGNTFFDNAKYFYFGAANSQYDNFKITSVDTMLDAVPNSGVNYVSKEIVHDMESYSEFIEREDNEYYKEKAHLVNSHDKKYGQVMEIAKDGQRIAFNDSNIITSGKKYYISFDAKTTDNTERFMWLFISGQKSNSIPRFMISDNTHSDAEKGATNLAIAENDNAFKYYIDGTKVARDEFKLSGDWRKYTLVIDTSNSELLAEAAKSSSWDTQIGGLFNNARYFHFGTDNAWFDNFRMVEVSEATEAVPYDNVAYGTEISYREADTTVDGEYISAGLRFKGKLPSGIAAEADEIGFVAAPSSLAQNTTNWYKLESEVNPIARKAIVKNSNHNYVYATQGDNTYYQLVFTGLSTEDKKTAYNRRFAAVMYTRVGDKYSYYPLREASYYQAGGISSIFNFDEKMLDVEKMASQDYKIVYGIDCNTSWVVKNQIEKLATAFNKQCVVDIETAVSDYEIVIGNTNRGNVGDVSALSNKNNYAIRISGSKVYVMGGSTYALQSAIYELETMIIAGKITEKEGSYLDTAVIDSTSEYKLVWQSEFDDPNTVTYNANTKMASIKKWSVDPITVKGDKAFLVSDRETVLWDNQGYLILRALKKGDSEIKYENENWFDNETLGYKQQGGIQCKTMEYNYGYLEMRARIPNGDGIYSSFWLQNRDNITTNQRQTPSVEIDIFESKGNAGKLYPNVHWWKIADAANNLPDGQNKSFFTALNNVRGDYGSISYNNGVPDSYGVGDMLDGTYSAKKTWVNEYKDDYNKFYPKNTGTTVASIEELYGDWHTIGLLWTDKTLTFYYDGVAYCTQDIDGFVYPDGTHAFANQLQYIVAGFNLGWDSKYIKPNADDSNASWDNGYLNYYIDYFRLYQIEDGNSKLTLK